MATKQTLKPIAKLKENVKKTVNRMRERRVENRRKAAHRTFRLTRRSEMPTLQKLPSWWKISRRTSALLWNQKSIIITLLVLFIILAWLISGMFSLTDFADIKYIFLDGENVFSLSGMVALFSSFFLAQNSTMQDKQAAILMLNLFCILFWLAFIWVARYEIAKKVTGVREALYTSGTSLVPFLMLLAVIFVQALPGVYGFSLARTVAEGAVFVGGVEAAAFSLLAFLLVITSVYFITSTIMALQVVALPGMYPWKAMQTARELISGRRLSVLRKYIMLFLLLAVVWIGLFAPTLVLENAVCGTDSCWVGITILPFMYYFLMGFIVLFASTYLYVTYRELLALQDKGK